MYLDVAHDAGAGLASDRKAQLLHPSARRLLQLPHATGRARELDDAVGVAELLHLHQSARRQLYYVSQSPVCLTCLSVSCTSDYFFLIFFLALCCPKGNFSSWEIRVAFPNCQGKPAAAESRYPALINYSACWVFSLAMSQLPCTQNKE